VKGNSIGDGMVVITMGITEGHGTMAIGAITMEDIARTITMGATPGITDTQRTITLATLLGISHTIMGISRPKR
jgi:hypothetical protein